MDETGFSLKEFKSTVENKLVTEGFPRIEIYAGKELLAVVETGASPKEIKVHLKKGIEAVIKSNCASWLPK